MSPWSNHNSGRCESQHMAHCKAGFDNCSGSSNLVGIGITSNLNKWELIPKLGLYVCIFLQHRAACKYIAFSLYFHALSAVFPDSWPLYFCKGKRIYHGHTEMYEARVKTHWWCANFTELYTRTSLKLHHSVQFGVEGEGGQDIWCVHQKLHSVLNRVSVKHCITSTLCYF